MEEFLFSEATNFERADQDSQNKCSLKKSLTKSAKNSITKTILKSEKKLAENQFESKEQIFETIVQEKAIDQETVEIYTEKNVKEIEISEPKKNQEIANFIEETTITTEIKETLPEKIEEVKPQIKEETILGKRSITTRDRESKQTEDFVEHKIEKKVKYIRKYTDENKENEIDS